MTTLISNAFRALPRLLVVGHIDNDVPDIFVPGHCASKALCFRQQLANTAALVTEHRCTGCAKVVHDECGYLNITVDDEVDEITCLFCFDKFGRVLGMVNDLSAIQHKSGPTDPSGTPSRNTQSSVKLTGGRSSLIPKVSSPPKTISAFWREKQEEADAKIDESNPSFMYERDEDEE
jgi:hypothetical protein